MRSPTRLCFASRFALAGLLVAATPLPAGAADLPNDTGSIFSGAFPTGMGSTCGAPHPAGQDCATGRDAAAAAGVLVKVGASTPNGGVENGFDYTKISNAGQPLPASAALGSGPNDWACTRDNASGLVWEVKLATAGQLRYGGHTYTWYDPLSPDGDPGTSGDPTTCANALGGQDCNTSNYVTAVNAGGLCGHTDWRMPTVAELDDLTDLGRAAPAVDGGYFPNLATPNFVYWSGSILATGLHGAWIEHFDNGNPNYYDRGLAYAVMLVRDGASGPLATPVAAAACLNGVAPTNPDTAYLVHGDGTVSDLRTGLMWTQCLEGQSGTACAQGYPTTLPWFNALAQARNSNFAGYADWRLPNAKELRHLVERCRYQPAINETVFPNSLSQTLWTGTPFAGDANGAWTVRFDSGGSFGVWRTDANGMRLVRDGPVVDIAADRTAVRIGQAISWTIEVANLGAADLQMVQVSFPLPGEVNPASAAWTCAGSNGAGCSAAGSGAINEFIALPAGAVATYVLAATVASEDEGMVNAAVIVSHGAGGIVRSVDTLNVLFRDGFQAGGDGAQPWP